VKKEILFISDLHLALEKPEITKKFLLFLANRAVQAETLYILGDLFDAWIGDDDYSPPSKKIRSHIKQLTDSGTKVFLQQGNRDFLLGDRFCIETGIKLLGDFELINLFGHPTLLTHGDLLCTDDIAYQQFRIKSHSTEWQQYVLSKPLWLRMLAARWYRFRSHFHKRNKTQEIMDVNQQSVVELMQEYATMRLIHGHTHRPAVHDFNINNQPAQRFVLADWKKETASVLCWSEDGYRVESF
jgi:UDP-2,3-diacylglucosamine hydrolase